MKERRTNRIAAMWATFAVVIAAGQVLAADRLSVSDLGTLGGVTSAAWDVNNAGKVVGTSTDADGHLRGFIWDGSLTGIAPLAGDEQAQAFAINESGVVATMSFDLGEIPTNGLLWADGATTDVSGIAARGINAAGTTVGHVSVSVPNEGVYERAAKWDSGVTTQLGTLGGDFSYAYAIDDAGRAVGMSLLTGNQAWHATIYQGGQSLDLGTLGGSTSQAYDINSAGEVVGVSDAANGDPHAFLFTVNAAGQVLSRTDLGTLDGMSSYAHAVNESGVVVGTSGARAFMWDAGVMTDLNTLLPANSGWVLQAAHGINESGWIVGEGLHNGMPRAFLLRAGEAVPAVSQWGLMIMFLLLAICASAIWRSPQARVCYTRR
jgi:probable HAF family extracellular repeat protein